MIKMKKNNITPFNEDVSKWYTDLVIQSELILYAPVKGTVYLRPYGYKIWDLIKRQLTDIFDKNNVDEVTFPLLIPESLFNREKEHIDGFAPEVLTVTRVGEKHFDDPLLIRPTSEVLFGNYYKETLNSYKQLPIILNQWVNVMRWEKNTRPFLRTSEFLWQEGHTVHATKEDAKELTIKFIDIYSNFANEYLLLPVITGEKTKNERFAGAENTYTIETILRDGQSIQSGTSHYLGQSFTKAFDVNVQDKDNKQYNPYTTSWGVSTRLIGAIIMAHSDDFGLRLPEKIAPFQIVIETIFADKNKDVSEFATNLCNELSKEFRVKLDDSDKGIGYKSQEWEVKGVPIRIEVGPNDLKTNSVVLIRRDNNIKNEININELNINFIKEQLKEYSLNLYSEAEKNKITKKVEIDNVEKIAQIVENNKYAIGYWTEDSELEDKIKEETGATIRCLIEAEEGISINKNEKTKVKAIFARAY